MKIKNILVKIQTDYGKYISDEIRDLEISEIISTKHILTLKYIELMIENISYVEELLKSDKPFKFAVNALRSIIEEIIEYIYLMDNDSKIREFFGSEIDFDRISKNLVLNKKVAKIHKSISMCASNRFKGGRPKVEEMARDINEVSCTRGSKNSNLIDKYNQQSLYEIYKILSENDHNSAYLLGTDKYDRAKFSYIEIMAIISFEKFILKIVEFLYDIEGVTDLDNIKVEVENLFLF